MYNYALVEQVARERQSDIRREVFEEQRLRHALAGEPRPSFVSRLISLFGRTPEPQPTRQAVPAERNAPAVGNQLNDCLAC